jgi:hypothetical protein
MFVLWLLCIFCSLGYYCSFGIFVFVLHSLYVFVFCGVFCPFTLFVYLFASSVFFDGFALFIHFAHFCTFRAFRLIMFFGFLSKKGKTTTFCVLPACSSSKTFLRIDSSYKGRLSGREPRRLRCSPSWKGRF